MVARGGKDKRSGRMPERASGQKDTARKSRMIPLDANEEPRCQPIVRRSSAGSSGRKALKRSALAIHPSLRPLALASRSNPFAFQANSSRGIALVVREGLRIQEVRQAFSPAIRCG